MAARKRPSRSARGAQAYNGTVREQLAELQRARILSGMFDVVCERGAGGVSVAHVVQRSGVSRRTFYEQFSDREDCLLASFEQALALAGQSVVAAYESERGWRERIRAGLVALLAFCDQEPRLARMLVVESQASGPRVAERRADVLGALTRIVDQGGTLTGTPKGRVPRGHAAAGKSGGAQSVSPLVAEASVGGVLAVIQSRLTQAKPEPLIVLTNELMSMIVLPYLGSAAARRELDRPQPAPVRSSERNGSLLSDPFKDAGMRLTYRTVRMLGAVAEHPDGSNRLIGESAGIADQGQISKLLARLQRIGLVTNTGIHPGKGAPNAWRLTEKGTAVQHAVHAPKPI